MGPIRLSGRNKRNREAELDDERYRKVAATLAAGNVAFFNRGEGSTGPRDSLGPPLSHQLKMSPTQPVPPSAGAAYESFLQQQRQAQNLLSVAPVSSFSTSNRASQAQILQALSGPSMSTTQQVSPSAGAAYESFLQQQHQAPNLLQVAPLSNFSTLAHASQAQSLQATSGPNIPQLLQLIRQQQGLSSAVSATASSTEQQLLVAPVPNAFTSSQASQAQVLQSLSGPSILQLLQHIRQQQGLSSAVPATESNTVQQLSVAPVPNASTSNHASQAQILQALSGPHNILQLLQRIQQRQGLSSATAAAESNTQQQLLVASAPHASTSSPLSQARTLQGQSGPSIIQLLQLIQQRQGLSSATAAVESNTLQQLQLLVASAPHASTSSPLSQARILQGRSGPSILQRLQHITSHQGLSSAASATEINTQQQLQDLALLASRESAVLGGMADQSTLTNHGHQSSARPADSAAAPPPPTSGIIMWLPVDNEHLSQYQIAVRKQLEVFEAKQEDVESIQGRKRWVALGQAGIRCRHCSNLPLRQRGRGAVYFPVKLSGMYQASQNMASSHLSDSCSQIPPDVKKKLRDLRLRRGMARGGKNYWADAGRAIGLYETEDCLRLRPGAIP
jgi:hypothetical protein